MQYRNVHCIIAIFNPAEPSPHSCCLSPNFPIYSQKTHQDIFGDQWHEKCCAYGYDTMKAMQIPRFAY